MMNSFVEPSCRTQLVSDLLLLISTSSSGSFWIHLCLLPSRVLNGDELLLVNGKLEFEFNVLVWIPYCRSKL